MKRSGTLLGALGLFLAGIIFGRYVVPDVGLLGKSSRTDTPEQNNKYTYINPLLFCSDQDISNYTNALPQELERKIRADIDGAKASGKLTEASVYYKDLNGGPWVLINGQLRTVPASLLKVPVALTIFKHSEQDPSIFDKRFTLKNADNVNRLQHFAPTTAAERDVPYSTQQLLELMLEDSDNGALYLLGSSLPVEEFTRAYSDLGIDVPTEVAPGYTMNVKTYASFFRVLFNASYLNRDNSERMLGLLAKSKFPQGLEAGVPAGTIVAHKFGEFAVSDTDKRLHDCGIVYKPHDPYILCIMTRGTDFDKLVTVIADISRTVYSVLDQTK